jgi:predicted GH43/DUF377 family glycosyl hydrolase
MGLSARGRAGRPTEFALLRNEPLSLERAEPLASMYTLSPFVWAERSRFHVMLRAVNRSPIAAEKVARIYYGRSSDGLRFVMNAEPALRPGREDADRDGCEDPTLAVVDDRWYVYYTGWNQERLRGELLLAVGSDAEHLTKRGVALAASECLTNPKEATIVQAADGSWRLFFEFAADGASKIGRARSDAVDGPWSVLGPIVDTRPGSWDDWHLSTGPVSCSDPERPVMFYNGATRDARWRIGWAVFDRDFTTVVERCEEPLITPPPAQGEDTDIAFAASHVELEDGELWLYYSVADKDMHRAVLRRAGP